MEVEIEDSDGLPVRVRVDYDAPLELMLSELGSIPDNIFPDDPRLRAPVERIVGRGCCPCSQGCGAGSVGEINVIRALFKFWRRRGVLDRSRKSKPVGSAG